MDAVIMSSDTVVPQIQRLTSRLVREDVQRGGYSTAWQVQRGVRVMQAAVAAPV